MLRTRLCFGSGAALSAAASPSSAISPTSNLSQLYAREIHSLSYHEIWSKIHEEDVHVINREQEPGSRLSVLLEPNRNGVEEVLRSSGSDPLTQLVSEYFDHSENASVLSLSLQEKVDLARAVYTPLVDLLSVLPLDGKLLSPSQCNTLYEAFLRFDAHENPFPSPEGSGNFDKVRGCFSRLETRLNGRLHKSRSRLKVLRRTVTGSALCLAGTVLAVIAAVAVVTTHAVAAFVCIPCIGVPCPHNRIRKKELENEAQLKAASFCTSALNKYMDNLDCQVKRLHGDVEHDKNLVRIGLEGDGNRIPLLLVMNDLRKNIPKFQEHLDELERHICLGFKMVNKLRKNVLETILFRQSSCP